jgi:hypothetical protein
MQSDGSSFPFEEVGGMPQEKAEAFCFDRMQRIDWALRYSYGEAGLICDLVYKGMLWRFRKDPETGEACRSFERWVSVAAPWSRSMIYEAIRVVRRLKEHIPEDKILELRRGPMVELARFSPEVIKDQKVMDAAMTGDTAKMIEVIQKEYPEQHAETPSFFRVKISEEGRKIVDAAIDRMLELELASGRGEALERMAVLAMESLKTEDVH